MILWKKHEDKSLEKKQLLEFIRIFWLKVLLKIFLTFLNEEKTLTKSEETMAFSRWLVETTLQNKESYQTLIEKHLKKGWKFERLSMMEKAILMIAACELLESDLPKTIVINEAVLNAKKFCDDDSYKFINGVLGQII